MPLPALRRVAARLLLLGISVVVGLLVAELAVRLVRPQPVMLVSRGLYAPDPPRRYRLQPGFRGTVTNRVEFDTKVSINHEGLRGPEIGPKAPGTFRVLALGDSFTFGVGAREEETWPARLQQLLRSRGLRAEVLNAGAPGFGVPDEVAWFQRWGWSLEPDAVVLAVFVANDLQDAAPGGPKAVAADGELMIQGEKKSGLSRWLYYHSHLYVLLKTSALGGAIRRLLGSPEPLETRELRTELDLYAKDRLPQSARQGAAATERAVASLARSAGGVRVLAVIIPSLIQVDPARWRSSLERFGRDPSRYDRNRPNDLFRGIFERHGIPVLDLTRPFAEALRKGERIYYPIDQHLTPAGYRLMAETVAGTLQSISSSPG
ncbi:MAG TPA: GDSL-type esterase/lipase family protein [Thermoanaerobaculia bacterium]|jgi:lysophospholipase L1-like esterase